MPRIYYDTRADEHIICLDERPAMQALERRYVDVPMKPGAPVKREFEYIRHGTLALMGALDECRGKTLSPSAPEARYQRAARNGGMR